MNQIKVLQTHAEIFSFLKAEPSENQCYLVGGAIRDSLLNQDSHDLDFVSTGNPQKTAKKLANLLEGAFFTLDTERQAYRVISGKPDKTVIDFVSLQGCSIEEDLLKRDFSINAIALNIHSNQYIDPLKGAVDLFDHKLKPCSPNSFEDDPLRLIRAVRFAINYQLNIEPETSKQIRKHALKILSVSKERIRDELFRIFSGEKVSTAIRLLDHYELLQLILPEVSETKGILQPDGHIFDVYEHTLAAVDNLTSFLDLFENKKGAQRESLLKGMFLNQLGIFKKQLTAHLSQNLNVHRSRRALLVLSTLLHDIGKKSTQTSQPIFQHHEINGAKLAEIKTDDLALSQHEVSYVKSLVKNHMLFHNMCPHNDPPDDLAVFQYFAKTNHTGIDICLLALADVLAKYGSGIDPDHWLKKLNMAETYMNTYWNKPDIVTPPLLINGNEIKEILNLKPGPKIGKILYQIKEEQVKQNITSREEAINFLQILQTK